MTSPVIVSVYTVAVRTDRRTTWMVASASAALLVGTGLAFGSRSWFGTTWRCWPGRPCPLRWGRVRSRRAYVAAVEERAEYAERTRSRRRGSGWRPSGSGSRASCMMWSRTISP
ncbi:hypothetical protein ACR6C2_01030 [Streptomyces sp. INA 01156]